MAQSNWGVAGRLPFKRRIEWDSLVVSKKSRQLEKSTLIFCHLQCQYCRWMWNISITTNASASLQPPGQGHVQSRGLQQRTDLAVLHKPQHPKVAYARCYKLCVHHAYEDCVIFFFNYLRFSGSGVNWDASLYIICTSLEKQYSIMQTKCLQRVCCNNPQELPVTAVAPSAWHSSPLMCFCSQHTST